MAFPLIPAIVFFIFAAPTTAIAVFGGKTDLATDVTAQAGSSLNSLSTTTSVDPLIPAIPVTLSSDLVTAIGLLGASANTASTIELSSGYFNPAPANTVSRVVYKFNATNAPAFTSPRDIIEGALNDAKSSSSTNVEYILTAPESLTPMGGDISALDLILPVFNFGFQLSDSSTFDNFTAGAEEITLDFFASLETDSGPLVLDGGYTVSAGPNCSLSSSTRGSLGRMITVSTSPGSCAYTVSGGDSKELLTYSAKSYKLTSNVTATAISSPVPGPLPILGVGAAFGFTRKLRKRIKGATTPF